MIIYAMKGNQRLASTVPLEELDYEISRLEGMGYIIISVERIQYMSDSSSKLLAVLVIDTLVLLIMSLFVMWLWNFTLPVLILGVNTIGYVQSVCLLVLVRITSKFAIGTVSK